MTFSLSEAAVAVLTAAAPQDKLRLTFQAARDWRAGIIEAVGQAEPPERPARPDHPLILPPNRMPRRSTGGSATGKTALLHALAHIEFNAIDLAWDIIARFSAEALPRAFYDDWVLVAEQEAEHFQALDGLMIDSGSGYGDLPAHDGLWDAARKSAHDLRARLAVVPMTLEARALDTAPTSIDKLRRGEDAPTVAVLTKVLAEEIDHVAAGTRWFKYLCQRDGVDAPAAYQALIHQHFPAGLKRPFNDAARGQAGLTADFYEPLGR